MYNQPYTVPLADETGNEEMIQCHELKALLKSVISGDRTPQKCGIRICNEKYIFN